MENVFPKKKILIFSTAYLPLIGGAEIAVKEITDRLTDYDFNLVCGRLRPDLNKNERIGCVNIYRVGWGCSLDKFFLPFGAFWLAWKIKPDCLWGLMVSWGSWGAVFYKILNYQTPFLLTLQEGDSEKHIKKNRLGLIGFSWLFMLRRADHLQVISQYLADLAKKFGYKREISVVPNGVDYEKFSRSLGNPEKADLKNKLGIREDEKIIISVSRLVEKNGLADLIDAMKNINAKLLIIGSGGLEKSLKLKVKSLKLEDKILFLGDLPNEEVPKYLAIADVFVRPSLSEGLGNVFLEAMAASVPVVGTLVGGIKDFLADGQTGLVCQVGNPKNIAEKINLLLSDENLRQRLIINGQNLVRQNYDWNLIAGKMRMIFDKLTP